MNTTLTNNSNNSNPPRRVPWRLIGWSIPVGLLLLPLIAMQFTREVDWGVFDFILMGGLMGAVGGGIELAMKLSRNVRYRVAAMLALVTGFLMVWVNMAVSIISDGEHPANVLYFVVVMGGLVGIAASRCRPAGLATTLYVMVGALVLIALGVIVSGSLPASTSPLDLLGITGFFSMMFLVSALLFRQAAKDERTEAGSAIVNKQRHHE